MTETSESLKFTDESIHRLFQQTFTFLNISVVKES